MAETFLIVLAGGVLLSAVVSDPRLVTLLWLRLGGILSLALVGVAGVLLFRRAGGVAPRDTWLYASMVAAILLQLAFVQIAWRQTQRAFSLAGFAIGVALATYLLPTTFALSRVALSCLGATLSGLALMDMLLGHAYLTAWAMKIEPFRRLNLAVAIALAIRTIISVALTLVLLNQHPIHMFWGTQGLYVGTRWFVGLLIPAIFVYMAHDCIKRKSTQSATGILYVAGVLIFIGEIISLHLVSETGLPF